MFLYIALFLGSFARRLILTFYGLFAADERAKVCMLSVYDVVWSCHDVLSCGVVECLVKTRL